MCNSTALRPRLCDRGRSPKICSSASGPRSDCNRWPGRSKRSSNNRSNTRSTARSSGGRSPSSRRYSTIWRCSRAKSRQPALLPTPPRRRARARKLRSARSRSPRCAAARRPAPARRSLIKSTEPWASHTSTRCIMLRAGCGRGVRSSATRRCGLPVSGGWSRSAAPTSSGPLSPQDREAPMSFSFRFDPVELPPEAKELREEVRGFVREEIEAGTFSPYGGKGSFSREFSRKVGAKGWIGMTWPEKYGGHDRSHLERYVVTEEMLAARAPTRAHSTADRQSGPVILRYGREEIKQKILPQIAHGELCFCIGLSEPNSGSDVFAASTRATKTDGGWLVNGRKIWTSGAHHADYMIALLRTSPSTKENRRHGLTQFLVEMKTPGITTRPVINLTGGHDFNEVVFDDAFLPDSHLIGDVDMAG